MQSGNIKHVKFHVT